MNILQRYWIGSVAASILVAIGIGTLISNHCKAVPKADHRPRLTNSDIAIATTDGNNGFPTKGFTGGILFQKSPLTQTGWGLEQLQKEIERVHAALPKGKLAQTAPLVPASYIMHTLEISQVLVGCTSAGAQNKIIWTNNLGVVGIVGGTAWSGVDMSAIEDAYVLAINLNNGDVYDGVATNEDHYSDRTGGAASANIPFGHPPYLWQLNPNDQIELLIGCRGLANYHIGASLTGQYVPLGISAPAPTPVAQGGTK